MNCLYCNKKTEVINSRLQKRSNSVWRRRRCNNCNNVFTSTESLNLAQTLLFETSEGKLIPFNTNNLLISVYDCLKHRDSQINDASALTDTIINRLAEQLQNSEQKQPIIKRQQLIEQTTEVLNNFDKVASIQYSALHKL